MSLRWRSAAALGLALVAILVAVSAPLWVALIVGAVFVLLLQLLLAR